MSKTSSKLDACDISPVRPNNKHQATPHRNKRKSSRRDQGIDAHTSSCSTPNTQSPRLFNRSLNSPSSSFPYSQENCPDVVWDFTSPKLPKGSRKKEIKLTIQELLENLNQCQVPETKAQSAPYVQLLENWMEKQNADTIVKKSVRKKRKESKNRPGRAIEGLKKFLENIPSLNQINESGSNSRQSDGSAQTLEETDCPRNTSKLNMSAKSFLGDDNTDNDSMEELWGEPDNSFIVKATQELDSLIPNGIPNNNRHSQDVLSTIPETVPSPSVTPRRPAAVHKVERDKDTCTNQRNFDVEKYTELLEQLTNVDWDSDLDDDEWENGFLEEEDALSLIPDEVLTGTVQNDSEKTVVYTLSNRPNEFSLDVRGKNTVQQRNSKSEEISPDCEREIPPMTQVELFNSFEDDSFEDEILLCQPEVLSRIDEVESLLSQQPKCTPEEIEKKKDEALKRRLRNRPEKKS